MPKLPKADAKAVNETEAATGFEPIPEGLYVARLDSVEAHTAKTQGGDPYWQWVYSIPKEHPHGGSKFWHVTSLGEKSRPFLKAVFDAYGVPADTDTDKLCGKYVILSVGQRVIKGGKRDGQMGNFIREVLAYDPDAVETEAPVDDVDPGTAKAMDEEPF